ncbi:WD40/YVTN/BNR-like repeat-containing protein [Pseudomonas putida]
MGSFKHYKAVLLCAMLALAQGAAQAANWVDVLDMPAKPSDLAVSSPLTGVARAGERLVAVGQRGHILYSDDAGKHWQQASVPVSSDLNAVFFPSAQHGWAVGNDGVVLRSDDAGQTWAKQLDGRQIGELVVNHYTALAKAQPGNAQWPSRIEEGQRLVQQGADKPLLDVWFANDRLGYVVGVFNLILRTEDGGKTWTPFLDRTENPQDFHLNAIASTGDALYIAGEQGLLLKWNEAEQRFAAVQTLYHGTYFGVVGKPGEVVVYGLRGNVLRSADGGASWSMMQTDMQANITAATIDLQGRYRLFSQAGHTLTSQPGSTRLQWSPQADQPSVVGAAVAADGSLVVVGSRGAHALAVQ